MTSDLGRFLHTLFGYDAAPAISQIVLYWTYLVAVLAAYVLWPVSRPPRQTFEVAGTGVVATTTGEKLNFIVTNESRKEPYEVEGEGGTELEEIVVPEGKTREVGFDVPDEPYTYEIKCYVPGDVTTIIEVEATAP